MAVVTGGTRGIGLACTVGLATLGATVVVVGRSTGNVEIAVEALVGLGLDSRLFELEGEVALSSR